MTYRRPLPPPPSMEEIEEKYKQDIAHIYDLLQNICTFKKVRFDENSNWTQGSNGYYKLQIPCTSFVALAAFEQNDGASDKRANCVIDANAKFATVTGTEPFTGYLVVANVNYDDDDALVRENNVIVDPSLSTVSPNPVANKAITTAINTLREQVANVVIPESLPASDVSAWAKSKTKPMYTWDEICGKPEIVKTLSVGGVELENHKGLVDLTQLIDLLNIPESLSDLEADISIYDLAGGEEFEQEIISLTTKVNNAKEDLEQHLADYEETVDDLETRISNVSTEAAAKLLEAKTVLTNRITTLHGESTDKIRALEKAYEKADTNLNKKIENIRVELLNEDTETRADISELAHECRLVHEAMHGTIKDNADKITDLYSRLQSPTNVTQIAARVNLLDEQITTLEAKTTNDRNTNAINNEATNARIDNAVAEIEALKVKDNNTDQDINDLQAIVEEYESKIAANETAIANAKTEALAAVNALKGESDTSLEELSDKVDAIVIPTKLSELTNDLELTQVEQSETNGNIKVNGNEIVVFTPEDINVPTKVSQLENDLNYVTRKQAQGLVASAQVNFDTAFEDDDDANITFVKTVNISNSQGSVVINGDDIMVNVDGVGEMQAQIEEQQTVINNQTTIINNLQTIITNLQTTITEMQTNIVNLQNWVGDDNGILEPEKGERPLSEKQDKEDAVTDSDAMDMDDITDAFNDIE